VAWLAFLCYKNKKARRMRAGDVMKSWQWALLLKPFLMFAFMFVVACLGRVILHFVPEGKVKRLLSRRFRT
jgi:hypothetical protein